MIRQLIREILLHEAALADFVPERHNYQGAAITCKVAGHQTTTQT